MRCFKLLLMGGIVLALAGPAVAITYDGPIAVGSGFTISNADMADWDLIYDNPVGNAIKIPLANNPVDIPGKNEVRFDTGLGDTYDGSSGTKFRQAQWGWRMLGGPGTLPSEYWDLSAYDFFTISIHNTSKLDPATGMDPSNNMLLVNVFINTGWTDIGETNRYYENGWTWLQPCQTIGAVLDLTGIPDAELQHVSAIGFNVGSNDPDSGEGWYFEEYEWLDDTTYAEITTDTVPEPITMAGLFLGIGCLGGYIRRRK